MKGRRGGASWIPIFHFKNRNFYVKKLEIYFYKEIFLVRRLENYYKDLMIYISIFACKLSKGALYWDGM